MTYVPDPNDATRPVLGDLASTAAEEFRKLKGKVNDLTLASGTKLPQRQTVLSGLVTATGIAAYLAASATALGVDLQGTSAPAILAFASGFNNAGGVDMVYSVGADQANFWPALAVTNTSFLSVDYVSDVLTPTPNKTLCPPQYGNAFDPSQQSLLQLASGAGLDDYGNTWAIVGAATINNTQTKFDTKSVQCTGAATDCIQSTDIRTLPDGSWTIETWAYFTANTGNNTDAGVISLLNAGNLGLSVTMDNTAGTVRWRLILSSDGATRDIVDATGASAIALNAQTHVAVTFDALAGKYFLYINGVQELTTTSSKRVCSGTALKFGGGSTPNPRNSMTGFLSGGRLFPYCKYPNGTAFAVPTAMSTSLTQGDSQDWFDTIGYKMYQMTGISPAPGSSPVFTAKNRLYLGEADTSAGAVTAVRSYAIQGKYTAPWTTPLPAAGTPVSKAANIGHKLYDVIIEAMALTQEAGFKVGDITVPYTGNGSDAPFTPIKGRVNALFTTGGGTAFRANDTTTGADAALTAADWAYRVRAERSF